MTNTKQPVTIASSNGLNSDKNFEQSFNSKNTYIFGTIQIRIYQYELRKMSGKFTPKVVTTFDIVNPTIRVLLRLRKDCISGEEQVQIPGYLFSCINVERCMISLYKTQSDFKWIVCLSFDQFIGSFHHFVTAVKGMQHE